MKGLGSAMLIRGFPYGEKEEEKEEKEVSLLGQAKRYTVFVEDTENGFSNFRKARAFAFKMRRKGLTPRILDNRFGGFYML